LGWWSGRSFGVDISLGSMTTPALYTAFQTGMSGASPMGVADLSFQSGIAMEKCGEVRIIMNRWRWLGIFN